LILADPRFLLDTNILIYLAANPPQALLEQAEAHDRYLGTSALCVAEALAGDRSQLDRDAIFNVLLVVRPLSFDQAAAEAFRLVPFKRGRTDRFIAAHALSRNLILVTNNEADFADVPGLRIENWTKPR
jgi:tRNA(fMet)-specific endonuclease VapC